MIPDLYQRAKDIQRAMLHDPFVLDLTADPVASSSASSLVWRNPSHPIAFTTDLWSGPDHESYICLSASWFNAQWIIQHCLLDIYLCSEHHTGENISNWLNVPSAAAALPSNVPVPAAAQLGVDMDGDQKVPAIEVEEKGSRLGFAKLVFSCARCRVCQLEWSTSAAQRTVEETAK